MRGRGGGVTDTPEGTGGVGARRGGSGLRGGGMQQVQGCTRMDRSISLDPLIRVLRSWRPFQTDDSETNYGRHDSISSQPYQRARTRQAGDRLCGQDQDRQGREGCRHNRQAFDGQYAESSPTCWFLAKGGSSLPLLACRTPSTRSVGLRCPPGLFHWVGRLTCEPFFYGSRRGGHSTQGADQSRHFYHRAIYRTGQKCRDPANGAGHGSRFGRPYRYTGSSIAFVEP